MEKKGRFFRSFRWAWEGIVSSIRREAHLKFHLCFAGAVALAGFGFGITKTEWLVCLLFFALVMGAELINTAVEAVVDLVSPEEHPLAKLAKDAAAGAVLVCAVFAAVAGCIIFLPRVWALLVR